MCWDTWRVITSCQSSCVWWHLAEKLWICLESLGVWWAGPEESGRRDWSALLSQLSLNSGGEVCNAYSLTGEGRRGSEGTVINRMAKSKVQREGQIHCPHPTTPNPGEWGKALGPSTSLAAPKRRS